MNGTLLESTKALKQNISNTGRINDLCYELPKTTCVHMQALQFPTIPCEGFAGKLTSFPVELSEAKRAFRLLFHRVM